MIDVLLPSRDERRCESPRSSPATVCCRRYRSSSHAVFAGRRRSAIARSDGTRASVLRNLRASRVTDGILGRFHFDRNGDLDPPVMPIERLAATRRGAPIEGAVFDRLITIPEPLARP